MPCKFDPKDLKDGDTLWSFGYGSNMDVESVQEKKLIKITESTPAVLADYKLSFNIHAMRWVEPAFANVKTCRGSEVHGVAFHMTVAAMKKLDSQEPYDKHYVTLKAYDGRELNGFVYVKENDKENSTPSDRYMGVIIKGALAAGLSEDYIENTLRKVPTYKPPESILRMRKARGELSDHKEVTIEELARHTEDDDIWISVLGYVVRPQKGGSFFKVHRGRDITVRQLMHLKQISLEKNDDGGKPPFPLVKDMAEDEIEYVTRWLDFYQAGKSEDGVKDLGEVVGHLKEFREQQESGKSDFALPGGQ